MVLSKTFNPRSLFALIIAAFTLRLLEISLTSTLLLVAVLTAIHSFAGPILSFVGYTHPDAVAGFAIGIIFLSFAVNCSYKSAYHHSLLIGQ